ncbi:MAG: DUF4276 family protein [Marinagarivorans sp.]
MIRVHVICEGQTEEMFVNEVMADIFTPQGIYLFPSLVGKPGHKGGNFKFQRVLHDVKSCLLDDTQAYSTTFFDFYGLPEDFPGKTEALALQNIEDKRSRVEERLVEQLTAHIGKDAMRRFIPYVQMYEFEGLLFSKPDSIASEIGEAGLAAQFERIRNAFDSPEHVNNSSATAPSKRIKALFDQYDKVIHGSLVALDIGITTMREECHLFNDWVGQLLALEVKQSRHPY